MGRGPSLSYIYCILQTLNFNLPWKIFTARSLPSPPPFSESSLSAKFGRLAGCLFPRVDHDDAPPPPAQVFFFSYGHGPDLVPCSCSTTSSAVMSHHPRHHLYPSSSCFFRFAYFLASGFFLIHLMIHPLSYSSSQEKKSPYTILCSCADR